MPQNPTLTSLTPTQGPTAGGTPVTMNGSNFQPGATVSFGGTLVAATITPTSITCTAPSHAAGAVDVRVTNPDGQFATLTAGYIYQSPPALASLTPTQGPTAGGTPVTINGSNFQPGATVSFGGTLVAPTITPTSITCTAPSHAAGAVDVRVTNPDVQFATLTAGYIYQSPPTLASLTPTKGPTAGGTPVTINGSNFQPGATVSFGGTFVAATITPTTINCTAPSHAVGAVDVRVTNPDGQFATLTAGYSYQSPPTLASLTPTQGPTTGGTPVTINGSNFQSGATATFGGIAATVTTTTPTSINCTAPSHAVGAVDVRVTNPDGQFATLTAGYSYQSPPTLASLTPTQGPTAGGTAVTINGSNFQSGATGTFGGIAATVTTTTPTSINCTAPSHAVGAVDVRVTNPDGQFATLTAGYSYQSPPTLASLTPTQGPTAGGTAVTINGSNFQSGATVTFGGIAATVTTTTPTSINCTAPSHAVGAVDVRVTNPDGQFATLTAGYIYQSSPTLASLTPTQGPTAGGTPVTINGSNFQSGATATFGGTLVAATITPTSITCTAPSHAAGAVDVRVTNPDGQFATLTGGFTYI